MATELYPIHRRVLLDMALDQICIAAKIAPTDRPKPSANPLINDASVLALWARLPAHERTLIGQPELRIILDSKPSSTRNDGNFAAHHTDSANLSNAISSAIQKTT